MHCIAWKAVPTRLPDDEKHKLQLQLSSEVLAEFSRTQSEKKFSAADACKLFVGFLPKVAAAEPSPQVCKWLEHMGTYCRSRDALVSEVRAAWKDMDADSDMFVPFKSLQKLSPFDQVWEEGVNRIKKGEAEEKSLFSLTDKSAEATRFAANLDDKTMEEGCFKTILQFAKECDALIKQVGIECTQSKEFVKHLSGTCSSVCALVCFVV